LSDWSHINRQNTMDTDAPNHLLMRGLAEAIAFGRSIASWPRSHDVFSETAPAWTELPEVQQLVEKCRLSHAERMVGKISGCVERAIDRLVELSEGARDPRIALASTKVIIKNWMDLAVHFVQERTYQWIVKRVKELRLAREADKRAMRRAAWG
jgi:hypothetical protein